MKPWFVLCLLPLTGWAARPPATDARDVETVACPPPAEVVIVVSDPKQAADTVEYSGGWYSFLTVELRAQSFDGASFQRLRKDARIERLNCMYSGGDPASGAAGGVTLQKIFPLGTCLPEGWPVIMDDAQITYWHTDDFAQAKIMCERE